MTDWKSALRADPTGWLLENASPATRYRVLSEILALPQEDPRVAVARKDALAYPQALKIVRTQRQDGTWAGTLHAGDPRKPVSSTELSLSMLCEHGYDRSTAVVKKCLKLMK